MRKYLSALLLLLSWVFIINGQTIKLNDQIGDFKGIVYDLCFTHSGNTLIIPEATQISFYNINTKELTKRLRNGHFKTILSVDMSVDSTILASGGLDGEIVVWNVQSDTVIKKLDYHKGIVNTLNLSPHKNILVSGSSDKTVIVYDLSNNRIVYQLVDFYREITVVKFSPDGQFLAVASLGKEIRLYNAVTGQIISLLEGHEKSVRDLCFSEDGTRLFSCGDDSRLITWDIRDVRQIKKEKTDSFGSDWLLTVDVNREDYVHVVSGLNRMIYVTTNFGTSKGKMGVAINKILFVPNVGSLLKFVVATRGKGVYIVDSMEFAPVSF
jgi:WD40 repeat protein